MVTSSDRDEARHGEQREEVMSQTPLQVGLESLGLIGSCPSRLPLPGPTRPGLRPRVRPGWGLARG